MTNATLVLSNVQPTDAGAYTVVVSNVIAAVTSSVIRVEVLLSSLAPGVIPVGGSTVLGAAVTDTGCGASYRWLRNGTEIPGATSPTLTLVNLQLSEAGRYSIRASNCLGVVTSLVATVRVQGQFPFSFTGGRQLGTLKFPPLDQPACAIALDSANSLSQAVWQPILTNTDLRAPLSIPAPANWTNLPGRYYRARLLRCP
jgi:hypothetical protein